MELVWVSGNLWITEGTGLKCRGARVVAQQKIGHSIPGSAQTGWGSATAVGAVLKYEGVTKTIAAQEIRGQVASLNPFAVIESHGDGMFPTDHRQRIRELPHRNVAISWIVSRAPSSAGKASTKIDRRESFAVGRQRRKNTRKTHRGNVRGTGGRGPLDGCSLQLTESESINVPLT